MKNLMIKLLFRLTLSNIIYRNILSTFNDSSINFFVTLLKKTHQFKCYDPASPMTWDHDIKILNYWESFQIYRKYVPLRKKGL